MSADCETGTGLFFCQHDDEYLKVCRCSCTCMEQGHCPLMVAKAKSQVGAPEG